MPRRTAGGGQGLVEYGLILTLTSVFTALGVGDRVQAALWVERHRDELVAGDDGADR